MNWKHRHTVIAILWAVGSIFGRELPPTVAGLVIVVLVTAIAAFALTYILGSGWQRSVRWYRARSGSS